MDERENRYALTAESFKKFVADQILILSTPGGKPPWFYQRFMMAQLESLESGVLVCECGHGTHEKLAEVVKILREAGAVILVDDLCEMERQFRAGKVAAERLANVLKELALVLPEPEVMKKTRHKDSKRAFLEAKHKLNKRRMYGNKNHV